MKMFSFWLNFVYPQLCLNCEEEIDGGGFCESCLKELTLLDPKERCRICFSLIPKGECQCAKCRQRKNSLACRIGGVFASDSPAFSLLKRERIRDAAAFMAAQLFRLNWPKIDLILPYFEYENKVNFQLAKEISHFIKCEVKKPFKIYRKNLVECDLELIKNMPSHKHLLLVTAYLKEDSFFRQSAETLLASEPKGIYVLSFCLDAD